MGTTPWITLECGVLVTPILMQAVCASLRDSLRQKR
jgi:hypothetical protein